MTTPSQLFSVFAITLTLNLCSQKVYSLLAEYFLPEGVILVTYFLYFTYLLDVRVFGIQSTTNGRVMKLKQDLNRETKNETA
jgi:hypothetical protein